MSKIQISKPTKEFTDIKVDVAITPMNGSKIKKYVATFDTGTYFCMISKKVVKDLGLVEVKKSKIGTIGLGEEEFKYAEVSSYMINIIIYDNVILRNVRVHSVTMPSDVDILIGLDIISQGKFHIESENNITNFSFSVD